MWCCGLWIVNCDLWIHLSTTDCGLPGSSCGKHIANVVDYCGGNTWPPQGRSVATCLTSLKASLKPFLAEAWGRVS